MGLSFGGLKSIVDSAIAVLANLVGQDVVAKSFSASQASGSDAFKATVAGARWHFGPGTTDYATSSGTTAVIYAGGLEAVSYMNVTSNGYQLNGAYSLILGSAQALGDAATSILRGNSANSGTAIGAIAMCQNAYSTAGSRILALFNSTTDKGGFTKDGAFNPLFTDDSATAGNRTVNAVSGANSIAALASTCVITNSVVKATSLVFCVLQFADISATTILSVVPSGTGFTITVNAAATADTKFGWIVFNGV